MRRFLIALVVLIVLLIAADFGARIVTERVMARQVASSLQLSERPSVSLGGFPFLIHFAEGRFPSALARANGFRAGGFSFGSLRLSLQNLRFAPGKTIFGGKQVVTADSGDGTATLNGSQATAALRARGIGVSVRFEGGKVLVRSALLPLEVAATLSVSGRLLVVRSADPAFAGSFSITLPEILNGLHFTSVAVEGSVAVIRFRLDHVDFRTS
jgi:hypothetical protein